MFKQLKKPILILSVTLGAFFLTGAQSYAAYEVINAKTVDNKNIVKTVDEEYLPTYNDPELPNFSPDDCLGAKIERKAKSFFAKRNKKKSENEIFDENITEEQEEVDKPTQIKQEKEEVVSDKNKFQINADKITYDDTEGNVYAKGNVEIISKAQNITLKADDAVLDKANQTIKLHNNVKIIKNGLEMIGEYMLVDLNEQNILMDDPTINTYSFTIKAQEGFLIANDIQMLNGTAKSSKKTEYPFVTNAFQKLSPRGATDLYDKTIDVSALYPEKKQSYTINAKELVLTRYKDHDSLLLKGSNVLYNNHKIVRNSDIEIISDKQNQVIETNAPEAGSLRGFGTYIGYGFVYKLPKGQTLKLMPAFVYKSGAGVGIIGRHQTPNSSLEAGWGSATSDLIARGHYKFSNGLNLRYGRHAYISEGFMGSRRPGYAIQIESLNTYKIPDLNAYFNQGIYAGFYSDYTEHKQESHAFATSRFRYMAQLRREFLKYENKEQDLSLILSGISEASATLYGNGDTVGIVRIGPFLTTKVRRWESNLGYLFAGTHGDSPFYFDKYRYGKSSIVLNEKFNFNNKFALGYRATVSPLKDNYEDDLLTESKLYAMFGPRDIKLALSYDFVREIAHLDFMFLLGSETTKINFDKLTTKGLDNGQEKRDFYKRSKLIKIDESEML